MSVRGDLIRAIAEARDVAIQAEEIAVPPEIQLPTIGMERPGNPEHGDWASNVAMQLAPVARAAPLRIAETIAAHLGRPPSVADVSVAPPGYLNLRLDPAWVASQVETVRDAGL